MVLFECIYFLIVFDFIVDNLIFFVSDVSTSQRLTMSGATESHCAKKAKLMSDKNETENEVIMFQKGDRIRIAHLKNNDLNYCFPSDASENSISNLVGDFGTIYKIYPKGKPKLQIDSVEKSSKEINFLVKLK